MMVAARVLVHHGRPAELRGEHDEWGVEQAAVGEVVEQGAHATIEVRTLLRQFGQSDRESIEGGRTTATVPQILAMFNGPITHAMLERGSVIYDEVMSHPTTEAVDVVFLAVLSHRPSASDRAAALRELRTASTPAVGCGNLIWALLNTRDFLFIQ